MHGRGNDGSDHAPPHVMDFRLHRHSRLPAWRFRTWALLLSGAAHIGLFAALGGEIDGPPALPGLKPVATVTVQLNESAGSASQASAAPSSRSPQGASHAAIAHAPADAYTEPPAALPQPHYFEAAEWTDAPALIQDINAEQLLVSPRLTAHPLLITLFINEQGGIDKVEIGGMPLPEFEMRLVDVAFAGARFQPARAGGLAVKSRLDIELKLENARSNPVPAETSAAIPLT
jgi:hypothetical protein